jgi:hypothetical protein
MDLVIHPLSFVKVKAMIGEPGHGLAVPVREPHSIPEFVRTGFVFQLMEGLVVFAAKIVIDFEKFLDVAAERDMALSLCHSVPLSLKLSASADSD